MKDKIILALALLSTLCWGGAFAQELNFSKEAFVTDAMTLPYRKATIPGFGENASLVIYLHGGTSKGDDNEAQLQEPGVEAISSWFADNNRKAILLVPQCPKDKSWIGGTLDVIASLLQSYVDRGAADANRVYILGGSMGGTGTWNMLSSYPNLFAAAMPVAGNPSGLNAEAVAQTPVFTVMGTADRIMKISNVEAFLEEMDHYEAEYKFNIEEGWSHENVCEQSYTPERLNWLFKHVKGEIVAVSSISQDEPAVSEVVWHSFSGQRLSQKPTERGVYLQTRVYDDGSQSTRKVCLRAGL